MSNSSDTFSEPELIEHIGWDLWRTTQLWKRRFNREMTARGYVWFGEARGTLLAYISRNGTGQTELVNKSGMTKQAVQQHLDGLVEDGVIERAPDPIDSRRKLIRFTRQGLRSLAAANEVKQAIEADYRRTLGDAALDDLKQALALIIAAESAPSE